MQTLVSIGDGAIGPTPYVSEAAISDNGKI